MLARPIPLIEDRVVIECILCRQGHWEPVRASGPARLAAERMTHVATVAADPLALRRIRPRGALVRSKTLRFRCRMQIDPPDDRSHAQAGGNFLSPAGFPYRGFSLLSTLETPNAVAKRPSYACPPAE